MQQLAADVENEIATGDAGEFRQQAIQAHQQSEKIRHVVQLREALKTPK